MTRSRYMVARLFWDADKPVHLFRLSPQATRDFRDYRSACNPDSIKRWPKGNQVSGDYLDLSMRERVTCKACKKWIAKLEWLADC